MDQLGANGACDGRSFRVLPSFLSLLLYSFLASPSIDNGSVSLIAQVTWPLDNYECLPRRSLSDSASVVALVADVSNLP